MSGHGPAGEDRRRDADADRHEHLHGRGTIVGAGTLVGMTGSLAGNIVTNGLNVFNQAASGTFFGSVSGSGGLLKDGTGVLTIANSNTHTGGTSIAGGVLRGRRERVLQWADVDRRGDDARPQWLQPDAERAGAGEQASVRRPSRPARTAAARF